MLSINTFERITLDRYENIDPETKERYSKLEETLDPKEWIQVQQGNTYYLAKINSEEHPIISKHY